MSKYEFSNINNVLEYLLQDEMGESSQIQDLINALSFQEKHDMIQRILEDKIGDYIYWADKNWFNFERHKIDRIDVSIYNGDFFGRGYKDTICIKIFIKSGGHYIAQYIGRNLFFTEEEALKHTQPRK